MNEIELKASNGHHDFTKVELSAVQNKSGNSNVYYE